jgi:GxxExxY protein
VGEEIPGQQRRRLTEFETEAYEGIRRNPFVPFVFFCKVFQVHPLYKKADELSHLAIGAAIEVHRHKGPGLIESIYERCMMRELSLRNLTAVHQRQVKIEYKGLVFEEPLRLDVLVEECLLLELKSVQEVLPIHKAQLFSYMKLLNIPIGLLINFHEEKLTDGLARMILPGANQ